MLPLLAALLLQQVAAPDVPAVRAADLVRRPPAVRGIVMDERLASDAGLSVGDTVSISAEPGVPGEMVRIVAIAGRRADPSEISRAEYRVRLHLDHLQRITSYGDRVDRFAIATADAAASDRVRESVNANAFGFRAHRSADIAVGTSQTFRVVSRFHRAIGVITIVASAIFLLCILLLKVEERRRDVGALRLIGISRRSVTLAVVLEAAFVSVLGSAMGAAIGVAVSAIVNAYYQGVYRTPLRFAIVTPDIVLLAAALSLALGLVAGYLAARRLARAEPLTLVGR